MLKILQARLQQYMNRETPDVQVGFRKASVTRDEIANICWIIKKAREPRFRGGRARACALGPQRLERPLARLLRRWRSAPAVAHP